MLRILHGADFHLDSPFAALTAEKAALRRRSQRRGLERLGELARARRCDLVLLSGDLLDRGETYRETALALCRCLGEIPCPVFLSPGNHDYYQPGGLYAALDWPENVRLFTSGAPEAAELPGLDCVVHGRAFLAPREERDPLEGFSAPRDGRLHLMVLHGEVDGRGAYAPIARSSIAASGLSYLALGHVHQYSGVQREGDTFWAYPGCPLGRGFDETGEKGVLYLELERDACRGELIPLGGGRYRVLPVELDGQASPLEAARSALAGAGPEDVCRLIFTGEREEPLDTAGLERALEGSCLELQLRDRTRPPRDVWARREEESLTGLLLREMDRRLRERPGDETVELALRYALAALERGEDVRP